MSASSGEPGFCQFCGHALNEHTKEKHSRCKKCSQRFYICQTQHGNDGHYRICEVPCSCSSEKSKKYYPSAAKHAPQLKESEYATSHPLYKIDYVQVTPKMDGDQLKFAHKNKSISSCQDDWQHGPMVVNGIEDTWWQLDTGRIIYFAWELPRQTAVASHGRTDSGSTDELHWSEARLEAQTQLPSMMANMNLEGKGQATNTRVYVFPRYHNAAKVVFEHNGERIYSAADSWVEAEDGLEFKSNKYGCIFFATEIKWE